MSSSSTLGSSSPGRGSLAVIFLTVLIDLLGFAMVIPLLPIYAKRFQSDENGLMLALLMASFSAMQFLFAPMWGGLSDRIGRRPVLLIGLAGAAVFYALFGIASMYASVIMLFVSRIGAGIACATIPVAQAYIADTTTLENRTKGMALIGAAFGVGFCFGPLLGAATLVLSSQAETSPAPGFVAAGLSAFAFMLALVKLPESLREGSQSAARKILDRGAWSDALATPAVGGLLLASFVSVLSFGGFETTLSLLLKSEKLGFGLEDWRVLLYFSFVGLILSIVQGGIIRRLSGRVSDGAFALAGVSFSILGFILLYAAGSQGSFWGLMFAGGIEVCGFAFITPSTQSLISRWSDPNKQGSVAGVAQSVSALGRIAGPLIALPLFAKQPLLPYAVSTVIMACGLIVLQLALRRGRDYAAR